MFIKTILQNLIHSTLDKVYLKSLSELSPETLELSSKSKHAAILETCLDVIGRLASFSTVYIFFALLGFQYR